MAYLWLILGLYTGEPRLWDGHDLGIAGILQGGFLGLQQNRKALPIKALRFLLTINFGFEMQSRGSPFFMVAFGK